MPTLKQIAKILILALLVSCQPSEMKIGVQPFGNFDPKLVDTIAKVIEETYNSKVYILEAKPLPENSFINIKSPRYRADSLLIYLKKNKPDSLKYIIGLTNRDISTTKKDRKGKVREPHSKYSDWGIFGLGYMPGVSCVASTFRISNNPKVQISRFKKICIHELGHNMGLRHCTSELCVMQDANETIKTVDSVNLSFCKTCQRKLGLKLRQN